MTRIAVQGHPVPQRPRKRPMPRQRLLPSLALMFLLAAVTRLGAGIGAAMAEGPETGHESTTLTETPDTTGTPPAPRDIPASAALLVQMTQREQALRLRETELTEREALLAAAVERLQTQIVALQSAEQSLSATMALADRAAEDDIARMVRVFQSMKPDEAARVFTEMDPDFAAGFLSRLDPDAAAAIMAGLEPRQAYLLSTIVAGRNALVPRN